MSRTPVRSAICRSSPDTITVHGLNLTTEILGSVSLGQMTFLEIFGRLPTPEESRVFESLIVVLVEHGLTPSVLAARLTYLEIARSIIEEFREAKRIVPGIGHPIHKDADPRSERLFEIAAGAGFSGRYVEVMRLVGTEASRAYGKHLPVNVSGAIGAVASELGLDWRICRGIGVMARSIGLVAHLGEEIRNPLARELWLRADEEGQEE